MTINNESRNATIGEKLGSSAFLFIIASILFGYFYYENYMKKRPDGKKN